MDSAEYIKMYQLEERNWWYKGRRGLVFNTIENIKQESKVPLKILDVGCGTGLNLKFLERYGKAYGLDFSEEAISFSKSRGETLLMRASADRMPLKNEAFDMVCALDVIEHVDNDIYALHEINRVLKSGGHFILTVPVFGFLWSGHDIAVRHKRRYRRNILLQNLKSSGFCIEKCTYWNFFLFPFSSFMRVLRKRRLSRNTSDLKEIPAMLNCLMLRVLRFENFMIDRNMNLPFGVSLFCVCRKAQARDGK